MTRSRRDAIEGAIIFFTLIGIVAVTVYNLPL